ncbi:MAG: hypothetical protein AAF587_28875 [Bacteroidota bacterium]
MDSNVKPLLSRIGRHELIRLCNEKMVCAARDLAEFTKNGINASFIVALAHKCEHYEVELTKQRETNQAEIEIKEALQSICDLGRRIWSNDPMKYNDYVISSLGRGPNDSHPPRIAR